MPILPVGGVIDNPDVDATMLPDSALREGQGEYRVGSASFWSARGRTLRATIGSTETLAAVYYAGFDGDLNFAVAEGGSTYYQAAIDSSLFFTSLGAVGGDVPTVGIHYNNRHYLATGASNWVLEIVGSSTTPQLRAMGMTMSRLTIGTSAAGTSTGGMDAILPIYYWATEYDSVRGIESIAGATSTGITFDGVTFVSLSISGTTANSNCDTIRIYRSLDGGQFPEGELLTGLSVSATGYTDTDTTTSTLSPNRYGTLYIGLNSLDRDEPPPSLYTVFGPFQDSLCGFGLDEPRVMRFTPAGFPESWPSLYGIPLESHMNDFGTAGVVLRGLIGVFTQDTVWAIYRLPRDTDSAFAPGEYMELITDERGCISRRGATLFTRQGDSPMAAFVARDGIFITTFSATPVSVTDGMDWTGRVDASRLSSCVLRNDPLARRLVFSYFKPEDGAYRSGVAYIDYQGDFRLTHPDHGSLADMALFTDTDGRRRLLSVDERASNGQVYSEGDSDTDESEFLDSDGSIAFALRTKDFTPAGAGGTLNLGNANYHHSDAQVVRHEFQWDSIGSPEQKDIDMSDRGLATVNLGKTVSRFSTRLVTTATTPFAINWLDFDGLGGGRRETFGE